MRRKKGVGCTEGSLLALVSVLETLRGVVVVLTDENGKREGGVKKGGDALERIEGAC